MVEVSEHSSPTIQDSNLPLYSFQYQLESNNADTSKTMQLEAAHSKINSEIHGAFQLQ